MDGCFWDEKENSGFDNSHRYYSYIGFDCMGIIAAFRLSKSLVRETNFRKE